MAGIGVYKVLKIKCGDCNELLGKVLAELNTETPFEFAPHICIHDEITESLPGGVSSVNIASTDPNFTPGDITMWARK